MGAVMQLKKSEDRRELKRSAQDNVVDLRRAGSATMRPGHRRAAIALMMLGPEAARDVLRGLSDGEVESLLRTSTQLKNVSEDEARACLDEFLALYDGNRILLPQAEEYVKGLVEETHGAEKVRALLGITEPPKEEMPMSLVAAADAVPEAIAKVLIKEHPQTMAIALSVMPPAKAAQVLAKLPAEQRGDVVRRIAVMKSITPDLLQEVGETLRRELDQSVKSAMAIDGQGLVINLLKALSSHDEDLVFAQLAQHDAELTEEIRKKMFIYEDLTGLDGRALQQVLKEVDSKTLALSLKTASTAIREHVLSGMSSRAATMILEDLEAMGPVAVNVIEDAQEVIVQAALRLASEGKIRLR